MIGRYLVSIVTKLPWQPQLYVNNVFVLSCTEFTFHTEVHWDNRHQPHTSLLWKLGCHSNQSETSINSLS